MAKQIISLDTQKVLGVGTGVNFLFWYPVASGREVPKPDFISESREATAAEIAALRIGTVVEEKLYREFPTGTGLQAIQNQLEALYADKKTEFDNLPDPNAFYGRSWDGTTWTPGSGVIPPAKLVTRVSGSPAVPAANSIIADSLALAAGTYRIEYAAGAMDTLAVGKGMLLEHRNAANNATLNTIASVVAGESRYGRVERITVGAGERIRWIAGTAAGAASSKYQGCIAVYSVT